ncbi:hypothetical protein EVAR_55223_1 [Eumeta japonica]|uniref:Uncharacterized protein n=1 Tax=Eumeta variegata TaxID=151549 RepID=A0A4C1ZS11_EUMVA|nr:hypothetical protein EVAR_55223_1 [Eumeta japonica]
MLDAHGRPASAEPPRTHRREPAPAPERRALSADGGEPRTAAARKAYPESQERDRPDEDAPLDLTVHARKEITVRSFARHPFAERAELARATAEELLWRQSLAAAAAAAARDSGTESDDSAGRLSPGDDGIGSKAYKKSLMKRYTLDRRRRPGAMAPLRFRLCGVVRSRRAVCPQQNHGSTPEGCRVPFKLNNDLIIISPCERPSAPSGARPDLAQAAASSVEGDRGGTG